MSDYNPNPAARYGTTVARDRVAVDEGLRAYMLRVYNYMTLGLAITGAVALGTFLMAVTVDPVTGARSLTADRAASLREPAQVGRDLRATRARVLPELPYRSA